MFALTIAPLLADCVSVTPGGQGTLRAGGGGLRLGGNINVRITDYNDDADERSGHSITPDNESAGQDRKDLPETSTPEQK